MRNPIGLGLLFAILALVVVVLLGLSHVNRDVIIAIAFVVAFAALGVALGAYAHAKAHHHEMETVNASGETVRLTTTNEIQTVQSQQIPEVRPSLFSPTRKGRL